MAAVRPINLAINNRTTRRTFLRSICAILVLLLTGCGGGTSGTDGGSSVRIGGIIQDTSGAPLSGVQVVVDESGDSDKTDNQGAFLIETVIPTSSATLRIAAGTTEGSTVVHDIPTDGSAIAVSVTIDPGSGSIEVTEISVVPIEEPTIAPTPATSRTPQAAPPSVTSSPTPTPTAAPRTDSVLEGTILIFNGKPLSGAFVTLMEEDATSITSQSGYFRFRYPAGARTLHLDIRSDVGRGIITLSRLPTEPRRISVTIEVSQVLDPGSENEPNAQTIGPNTPLELESEQRDIRKF